MPIPNEHTERLDREGARARHLHPERVDARRGSALARRRLQHDVPDRPGGHPLQVPQGEPVDSRTRCTAARTTCPGYDEPLFPVADTPIGRIGCAICYDWLFPEAIRQLAANGAEVLVRVSAYMDPWGATEPMNWWTIVNRCRAHREHRVRRRREPGREPAALPAVLVAGRHRRSSTSTAACSPRRRPDPASGSSSRRSTSRALRHERATRRGHHMLAHLRTEAYPVYAPPHYPPAPSGPLSYEENVRADRSREDAAPCRIQRARCRIQRAPCRIQRAPCEIQ